MKTENITEIWKEIKQHLNDGDSQFSFNLFKSWHLEQLKEREKEMMEVIDMIPYYNTTLKRIHRMHNKINWDEIFLLRLRKELKSELFNHPGFEPGKSTSKSKGGNKK